MEACYENHPTSAAITQVIGVWEMNIPGIWKRYKGYYTNEIWQLEQNRLAEE